MKERKEEKISRLNLKDIKTLVETMAKNNIREFSFQWDGVDIKIVRTLSQPSSVPLVQSPSVTTGQTLQPVQKAEKDKEELLEVKSPPIGIVHLSPAPDQPPFVKEGQTVKKDDVLCLVDTRIKTGLEEIKSPCSGTVKEIRIQEGQVIDCSTILFTIQPEELQEEKSEPEKIPAT